MPVVGLDQPVPAIGQPAPYFYGESTRGIVRLTDFGGRWLVLFSYPADFTPVCGSEVVAFARRLAEFEALGCRVLALSPDSLRSHAEWCGRLHTESGVEIGFPIVADMAGNIARRYGMLRSGKPGLQLGRSLFVIDPHGVIQAAMHYPCGSGRSVGEVLRLVHSLAVTGQSDKVTPEGWQPGQALVSLPGEYSSHRSDGEPNVGCVDWYDYRPAPPVLAATAVGGRPGVTAVAWRVAPGPARTDF